MTHALWERMDTIERFAADVAHELKNPLTSLRSAVETAVIVKKKGDREKLLGIIKHDVERLDRLISDISNASRLDAELSRQELERVDLNALLHSLLNAYRDPLTRKEVSDNGNIIVFNGVKLRLDLAFGEVLVWGLDGRLQQVFQNLISNALSFSPANGAIRISVSPDSRFVKVMVEDEGPGIPPGKLETVFERFYSERPQHESYGRHSGLGLSICRQIVTALGGEIYAENITGLGGQIKGARFTVLLRIAQP
jgi:two-component system sensor histidine kinase ChvG